METFPTKIKKIFTRNLGYKMVSFLAALALWSGFVGRGEYVLDVELGINYLLPAHFTIHNPPEILRVKMKGPEMAMKKYSRHNKSITVDLVGFASGEHQIPISRKHLELPPGIQVLNVKPDVLLIRMSRVEGARDGN